MITEKQTKALKTIYEKLKDQNITWAITGSLGFALHGMEMPVNDIDIQTDEPGAYKIEELFKEYIETPIRFLESEKMKSHIGQFVIEGVEVEVMGAIQKKLSDFNWEEPININNHLEIINYKNMELPVLSLEYEEEAYRNMGRIEKADRIKKWIAGKDIKLDVLGLNI